MGVLLVGNVGVSGYQPLGCKDGRVGRLPTVCLSWKPGGFVSRMRLAPAGDFPALCARGGLEWFFGLRAFGILFPLGCASK